jgi:hypothetical protein
MENSFQTSFIPKKLIASNISDKEPRNFFSLIAIFILIISVLLSVGLYVYKLYLTKQEETLSSSLATTRDSFEKSTIDELELFDKRTQSAEKILNNHVVLSPMFALLGDITIPAIQYTSFAQDTDDVLGYTVNIKGVALDYRSIALQADMFNTTKGSSFKNVLFSDLTKDKNNNITFNLKFNVDPSLLSYGNSSLLEPTTDNSTTITPVTTPTTTPSTTPVTTPATTTTTNPPTNNLGNQTQ